MSPSSHDGVLFKGDKVEAWDVITRTWVPATVMDIHNEGGLVEVRLKGKDSLSPPSCLMRLVDGRVRKIFLKQIRPGLDSEEEVTDMTTTPAPDVTTEAPLKDSDVLASSGGVYVPPSEGNPPSVSPSLPLSLPPLCPI